MAEVPEVAPVDQIKRFVGFARVARHHAARSRGETRNLLLNMAEQWERLAACSADLARQALDGTRSDER
jgi:hypothetical protein